MLEAAHERLASVWIECLPWPDFLARWDRPDTLFFLDPPYHGSEHYYGRGMFERQDFEALSEALKGLRGRFVMTLNDVPEIRRLFRWAKVTRVPVTYTVAGKDGRVAARELIIRSR